MIRVSEDIKEQVNDMTNSFYYCKTQGDVIEKLIKYYHDTEKEKKEQFEQEQRKIVEREKTMIYVGEELKEQYKLEADKLGLIVEGMANLLLVHYQNSDTIDKATFKHAMRLK